MNRFKRSITAAVVMILPTIASAQWATNGTHINNTNTGNVGIGTANPTVTLELRSNTRPFFLIRTDSDCSACNPAFAFSLTGVIQAYIGSAGRLNGGIAGNQVGDLYFRSQNKKIRFSTDGGLSTSFQIDETGNTSFTHDVTVAGNIAAKYQDVAEWVPTSEAVTSGTVVILDVEKNNHVRASHTSYDTRVAGVVSVKPGLILGEAGPDKAQIATTGRVKVKVDASKGAIKVGDLLVSSDRPGFAMKSVPLDLGGVAIHRPGTIIGKALEPLSEGEGEVLILLSLQ
ncbi:MAG TPA: hypothetical protein VE974_14505 [Thermoanaerobaculia bacterium]|nr:hypothetical protein [Thermoanaerobaculia bacterium]